VVAALGGLALGGFERRSLIERMAYIVRRWRLVLGFEQHLPGDVSDPVQGVAGRRYFAADEQV